MFKNLATWTNRKLKWTRIACEALVTVVGYVAPLVATIAITMETSESRAKIPLVAIFVSAFLISALAKYFAKSVAKLSIYDSRSQTLKHVLEMVARLIVPVALLLVFFFLDQWFREQLSMYLKVAIACVSFFGAGVIVDRLVVAFLDDETEIREKAKEQNAIQSRRSVVRGE